MPATATRTLSDHVADILARDGLRFSPAVTDIAAHVALSANPCAWADRVADQVAYEVRTRTGLTDAEARRVADVTVECTHPDLY